MQKKAKIIAVIVFCLINFLALAHAKAASTVLSKKNVSNKRITLNFQDIEVRAVLQLIAEFTGINMIVSDKVMGNITLRLNDLAWEEALAIILKTRDLEQRMTDKVMFIAPTEEFVNDKKKSLQAQIDLKNIGPLDAKLVQVHYAKAKDLYKLLSDKNSSLLSLRGKLGIDERSNSIWVQDTQEQVIAIKKLINTLDVPVQQVLIEARIVNVTRDFTRDLGLHFGMMKSNYEFNDINNVNLPSESYSNKLLPLMDRLNIDFIAPIPSSPAALGIALAKLSDGILLDLELSALESEGKGQVISKPRLITTNQQTAMIESGEEIPYQETTASGATAVIFKKAVLSLKVTPQITPDRNVLMAIQISQDIPSAKIFNGVPAILTKEIQTNVLVNHGQTIVLGGIYKQDENKVINRVPFMWNLPLIGFLFKNQTKSIRNEELLIFITPRIIPNTTASPLVAA